MIFGNKTINMDIKIKIDNEYIAPVKQHIFLGITLDHKLSWKPHISNISIKISKCISIMHKSRYFLNDKSLYVVYCSLVMPHITYCLEVWGNTYKTNLHSLTVLQKRAIRIVHNAGFRDHTNALFLKSKALKFVDLVNFYTLQVLYKAYNNMLPNNIQQLFKNKEVKYNLRGNKHFEKQHVHSTFKQMFITWSGVDQWNGLDLDIRYSTSIHIFKQRLKQKFLDNYAHIEN